MRTILGAGGVIANELVRMRRGDLEPTPYPEGIERYGPLLRRTRAITPARCPMLPHSNNESAPR